MLRKLSKVKLNDYDHEVSFRFLNVENFYNLCVPNLVKHLRRIFCFDIWDDTHMTSMKTVQFSRPLTSLVHLRPWFFHPLWPWTSNLKWILPPLQMITNQLKGKIIQGWLLYDFRSFLHFQYQLIDFVWLTFDFFSFNWSLTSAFSWLYILCVQLPKNITKFL